MGQSKRVKGEQKAGMAKSPSLAKSLTGKRTKRASPQIPSTTASRVSESSFPFPAEDVPEVLANPLDTQWPPHKRALFRPNRTKYILGQKDGQKSDRKNVGKKHNKKPESKKEQIRHCVFCQGLARGVKKSSLVIYTTRHAMVILNKYPYNSGHLLVLPKEHCGDPVRLSLKAYLDVQETVRMCVEILQDVYRPAGINLGANLGKAAGAGIPQHLHYHVIPRWSGDLNFFQLVADSKTLIETVEQTYARLIPYFRG